MREKDSDDESNDAEGERARRLPIAASDDEDASDVWPITSDPSQSTAAAEPAEIEDVPPPPPELEPDTDDELEAECAWLGIPEAYDEAQTPEITDLAGRDVRRGKATQKKRRDNMRKKLRAAARKRSTTREAATALRRAAAAAVATASSLATANTAEPPADPPAGSSSVAPSPQSPRVAHSIGLLG